jgi:hypothetical protein
MVAVIILGAKKNTTMFFSVLIPNKGHLKFSLAMYGMKVVSVLTLFI